MINLMPDTNKKSISYSRLNSQLIGWVIGVGIAVLGLMVFTGGSLFYLKQDTNQHVSAADKMNQSLEERNQEEVIARVNELSGNLKLTLDVLSNEVLFSKLLTEIGKVMPPDTVLTSLSLNSDLTGALDLTILSVDYESGVKAQVNLTTGEDRIFDKADIGEVKCAGTDSNSTYPCTSSIRALFAEDNDSFLKLYKEPEG